MKPITKHTEEVWGGERDGYSFLQGKEDTKWAGKKLQRQLAEDNCVRRHAGWWKKSVWSFIPSVLLQQGA